jgi:predicted N-acetyltransferase YhbS
VILLGEEEAECRILGTLLIWIAERNKTGYLVELAVEKTMKRKGIGSKLVQALVSKAKESTLRSIIVETQLGRRGVFDFYLSQDFWL